MSFVKFEMIQGWERTNIEIGFDIRLGHWDIEPPAQLDGFVKVQFRISDRVGLDGMEDRKLSTIEDGQIGFVFFVSYFNLKV